MGRSMFRATFTAMHWAAISALAVLLLSEAPAWAQADLAPHAGKKLAVQVTQQCTDPSVAGFLLDQDDDDCSAEVLASIRQKISSVLASKGLLGPNPDLVLTVTMTKRRLDTGGGGFIGDFTATAVTAANYTLTSSAGTPPITGTVSDEDGNADDDEDALELKFANKLVADVVARLPADQAPAAASPPRLGLGMVDLAPSLAEGLGRPELTGVQVTQCIAGSLAEKAGFSAGDIIYEFDGKAVTGKEGIAAAVAAEPAGKVVSLKVLRGKQDLDIQVQF